MQISPNLHFQVILLQVDLRWALTLICDLLTAWTYEVSHIISIKTKLDSNRASAFQMRLLSHFQPILQLDLRWPLTLICDLRPHQQMRVSMLHLWPNFGWNPEIHQSMWKVEPNVNLFSQQQQQTTPADNNSGQSDPCVSFLPRQATQKAGTIQNLFSQWAVGL